MAQAANTAPAIEDDDEDQDDTPSIRRARKIARVLR
jgi:hypothetical protein